MNFAANKYMSKVTKIPSLLRVLLSVGNIILRRAFPAKHEM